MTKDGQPYSIRILKSKSLPACLRTISSAPDVLYLKGFLPASPRIAIVGARHADDYGLQVAHQLGLDLARAKVSVVSGGAAGVDTAALQGCLEGGGNPVAVLGTGIDVVYPASNKELFAQVAASGALLSEYSLGTPGHPHNFPRRNRLISALADGVVVVRAKTKSGSLITADYARKQGRVLMAVPGPIGQSMSSGGHQLIRNGAVLVEGVSDVLRAVGLDKPAQTRFDLTVASPGPQESNPAETHVLDLEPLDRLILSAVSEKDCSIDELCVKCDLESFKVSAQLLLMELKGLVVQLPGMKYSRSNDA